MLAHGVEPGRAGFQAWPGRRLRLRLRLRLSVRVSVVRVGLACRSG